jgi:hypothetical protein
MIGNGTGSSNNGFNSETVTGSSNTGSGNHVGYYGTSSSFSQHHQHSFRSHHNNNNNNNNPLQPPFRKIYINPSVSKRHFLRVVFRSILICVGGFVVGCLFTASILLNWRMATTDTSHLLLHHPHCIIPHGGGGSSSSSSSSYRRVVQEAVIFDGIMGGKNEASRPNAAVMAASTPRITTTTSADDGTLQQPRSDDDHTLMGSILRDLKILVVIVSYDFAQLPHLEEVVQAYHDVCVAGAHVDVIIHATVPYPVTLIDLWNTRITSCERYTVTIVLKPKSLRLFLVDEHRQEFYSKIHEYDLFIYTEDDIRVTPTTVATYMSETQYIQSILSSFASENSPNNNIHPITYRRPSDFNVGIVRYEYNYPTNVIMDDNTRHATQNVSRVRWF